MTVDAKEISDVFKKYFNQPNISLVDHEQLYRKKCVYARSVLVRVLQTFVGKYHIDKNFQKKKYPKDYTKADLTKAIELESNKSFGTYMFTLIKVVERNGGKIRLVKFAFPYGPPCDSKKATVV